MQIKVNTKLGYKKDSMRISAHSIGAPPQLDKDMYQYAKDEIEHFLMNTLPNSIQRRFTNENQELVMNIRDYGNDWTSADVDIEKLEQEDIRKDYTDIKIGRNQTCPCCDSGKKYKRCCGGIA